MPKQRLHYFDVIKGIAIILVVMGHVMYFGIHNIDKAFILKSLDKIHMPLFFFISGYFTYKFSDNKVVLPNLFSRFKQLIIPLVCVSALWIYYFPHSGIESLFDSTWEGLYTDYSKNGYWFTLCLFEIILLYSVIAIIFNKITKEWQQILVLIVTYAAIGVACMYGNGIVLTCSGLPLVFQFFPIFFIGVFAKKHHQGFNALLQNNTANTLALIFGGFLMYFTCYYWEFPKLPQFSLEITKSFVHIAVVLVVFATVKPLCEKAYATNKPSFAVKSLQYIGKESLTIYLLHYFFLFPMGALRQPMIDMGLGFAPLFVVSFIASMIIITMVLGVKLIIERSKLLSLLLLGKV